MSTTTPASTRLRGRRHRRRLATTLVAVVLGITTLAACQPDVTPPSWPGGKLLAVDALGAHAGLDWRDANDLVGVSRYQVQVAEVVNGTRGAWVTYPMDVPGTSACVLVGLNAVRHHDIRVTAFDAAGNWSGDLTGSMQIGFLGASYSTPPSSTGGGTSKRCLSPTDTDADRVPNVFEGGTGSPSGFYDLGTSPTDPDSDDDGLEDGDELYGAENGLDLPGMGTTPLRKDVLVEVDWATEVTGCSATFRPAAAWVDPVRQAFSSMPVSGRPGGPQNGVRLIVDYGQGGPFTGGNAIPDANGRLNNDPVGVLARTTHFAPERVGYFHYATIGTEILVFGVWGRTGVADYPGDEFKLGIGCGTYSGTQLAAFFMHELGHNLYLHHGGHEAANRKPNYGSVMNYRYMNVGADGNCDGRPDPGLLAYSDEVRLPIDENHIDEATGFCPGVPADIDLDGTIDPTPYAFDVNGGGRTVLHGSDDFARISFDAFNDPNRTGGKQEVVDPLP